MKLQTSTVENIIRGALRDVVGSGPIAVGSTEVRDAAKVVINQTNNEPWYQSRVTWSALAAIASGVGTVFGLLAAREWSPNLWITALTGIGAGIGTLYGRWVAKKPLGA